MNTKKAFTLIELLVVISIIALLVAILMPALNKARQQATAAVCMANCDQLTLAWVMYADDNDDKLPCAAEGNPGIPEAEIRDSCWISWPKDENGVDIPNANAGSLTVEDKIRGIQGGVLYPYVNTAEVYHCPGDKREHRENSYRSYGIPGSMNGSMNDSLDLVGVNATKKYTAIRRPSSKFCFIEEKVDIGGQNWGAWNIEKGVSNWRDPIQVWHGRSTIIGFADGHVEKHTWVNELTLQMSNVDYETSLFYPTRVGGTIPNDQREDIDYVIRIYTP